jgi:hypothetical protein
MPRFLRRILAPVILTLAAVGAILSGPAMASGSVGAPAHTVHVVASGGPDVYYHA